MYALNKVELQAKKYVYLRPKPRGDCTCKTINENVANKLVENVFKSMHYFSVFKGPELCTLQ